MSPGLSARAHSMSLPSSCICSTGAEQRVYDYFRGASKTGEIAGRRVALLVMATYGIQKAVAVSNRSWPNQGKRPRGRVRLTS